MARLDIPCLILDEEELKQKAVVGEWRQDRHNLEAARIFGGAHIDSEKFPNAFQRARPKRGADPRPKSLLGRIKTTFRIPTETLVPEHKTSATTIDTKDVVGLCPNMN